jgi:hypothetical protein
MDAASASRFPEDKSSKFHLLPSTTTGKLFSSTSASIFTQSATSYTRGVIKWTIPKARRFKDTKPFTKDVPLLDLGSTLSKTSTSLGFGKRYSFRPVETPGPSISHRSLPLLQVKSQAVLGSASASHQSWDTHKDIPGPGSYEIQRGFVNNKGVAIKSRLNPLDPVKEFPGPDYYSPSRAGTERNRYAGIGFGSSKRYDFTKQSARNNPGPGTYEVLSTFEKIARSSKTRTERRIGKGEGENKEE